MTEQELIKKCVKGNRAAQEALYQKHAPVLYGICLKYSRNRTEAEDNLHDSFMTIYEKIHQYKSKGSFEGWLKRITVNTVLQKYRKKEPLKLLSDVPDQSEELEGIEDSDISLALLLKYIQELPQKYRLTFNMYVLDGYSHKEISEALGTSEGTSKSNLSRARMILQEKILKKKQIA
ncbi:RNA polymerase sigma factor [Robiginitalea aurantiaca]|uniref:Sigma-70 family RNA polymerase sigma factor n=1 Tax=Robiginitalea aurantiaca TaxID=3056915 RepID=A0ABT7WAJ9_9FLAO|nr:sigma-70 family RNA polymerase sigma factor [Robiginitalea aurantiaca]MDM9629944.1 sigma-70 family RNA polymerase sigma factor [Robiginitalea aurantiaca]